MKTAVTGFILIMLSVLSIVGIGTVQSKTIRQNELDTALSNIQSSLETLNMDGAMKEEELVADAVQEMLQSIKSDTAYEVKVYQADTKEGVLEIQVQGTYKQVLGEGKISARHSFVYDDIKNQKQGFYKVVFQDNKDILKELQCKKDTSLKPKDLPKVQGIRGWKLDMDGKVYTEVTIGNVSVTANLTFVAVK